MPLDGLTLAETRHRPAATRRTAPVRVGPVGAALLGHAVLLALAARLVIHALPGAPEAGGFPLFLERTEAVGASTIPAAPPVFDALKPLPPMVVETRDGIIQAAGHHRPALHALPSAQPGSTVAQRTVAPAQTAGAPQAVTAAPDSGSGLLPGLESRIDEAVRQAAILPDAARRQRRAGRAQIRFTYRDGGVQDAQIVASSQSRLLDNAALQAVRDANYPQPPLPLRGRQLTLLVWIDFRLTPEQG